MTIQRQYSLPNCSLILEGLSTDGDTGLAPMSVLLNVECHLPGAAAGPLTGGREFLDNLVVAVSSYAQRLLSGIAPPMQRLEHPPLVELKAGEGPYHHLIVRSDKSSDSNTPANDTSVATPLDIRLSTVQFYDLMEAVDQLLTDAQTLPDLALALKPVSRRLVKPAEPVAKRVAPAVIGASTLAAAALALFFVPLPEFEPRPSSGASVTEPTTAAAGTTPDTPPTPPNEPATETPSEAGTDSGAAAPAAAGSTVTGPVARSAENAPEITDAGTVEELGQDLAEQLQDEWALDSLPAEDWRYEVTVSQDGDILGYISRNDAALANDEATPLPQLLFRPPNPTAPITEPVARFITRFTPGGEVVVEPAPSSSLKTSEATEVGGARPLDPEIANPIRDGRQIETLNADLRRTISSNRKSTRFPEPVTYRVRLNEAGDIVGFVAVDSAADAAVDQTPLPDLTTAGQANSPQSDFMVVFTEDGTVQVSPWNGWPD
ncbi:MAG: DUF4335 domain-containing protein [Cyanobacteria bacterium Co-bin8]|nr:DUF4335 domain-containing protein [Cyanobacteria bacterium Co-bin8]